MPDKIITDQPQAKRRTVQHLASTSVQIVLEAPYFSVPLTDEDVAVVDPADANRELRAGELFFASGIQVTNSSAALRTLRVEVLGENNVVTHLAHNLPIPPNATVVLPPGLSLFKRNLANPSAAGARLRVRASGAGLQLTTTIVEREAIDHSPDTETA